MHLAFAVFCAAPGRCRHEEHPVDRANGLAMHRVNGVGICTPKTETITHARHNPARFFLPIISLWWLAQGTFPVAGFSVTVVQTLRNPPSLYFALYTAVYP